MMMLMQGMGMGGMGGMGGMMGMDMEKTILVQRVKTVQRQEGGKEKWQTFVEEKGGWKKDPNLKSVSELKEFLMTADPDGTAEAEVLKAAGLSKADAEVQMLAQKVKTGQRASAEFKEAWGAYCEKEKEGVRDPSKHDAASLQAFLASAPALRLPENDENHQNLCNKIKAGQRKSSEYKDAWHNYCQGQGSTTFDPAKYDSAFLQTFLDSTPEPAEGDEPASKRAKVME